VDDWGALEKHCGFTVTVGSNPTLSARRHPFWMSFSIGASLTEKSRFSINLNHDHYGRTTLIDDPSLSPSGSPLSAALYDREAWVTLSTE
jgi:hypothetical protein